MNIYLFEKYFSDIVPYSVGKKREMRYDTRNAKAILVTEQPAGQEGDPEAEVGMGAPQEAEQPGPTDQGQGGAGPEGDLTGAGEAGAEMGGDQEMGAAGTVEINIGRVYELKRVFSKLMALSNLLDTYSDVEFEEVSKQVLDALDLFNVISLNLDKFVDKIDNIIVEFYKFITSATAETERLVEKKSRMEEQE